MKLLNLSLSAVGPFTGVVLDLSAGREGLHLIHGLNEAGKSSALRAVSHLLFGFPHLSADNFVHPNDQLRVGGTLRHSDGTTLEVIRRRGNKNTLRGPDDSSVVPQEKWKHFLGDLTQDSFETLFGIDHQRLSLAGEEIRTGKGRLGEILFAAGAGLVGLRQAQKTLQDELDDTFRARASTSRINKLLAELVEKEKKWKSQQLSSESWLEHDRGLREATHDSQRLREEIRAARIEHGRLERLKSAKTLVARLRRLTGECAELEDVVRLRDDFGAELRQANEQKSVAEHAIEKARTALEDFAARLAALDPPQLLLDAAGEIELLQEHLGFVEKASADKVKNLENPLSSSEHRARQILRELGRSLDLDEAETLRLRADEPMTIRALGQRFAELRGQTDQAKQAIARHEDQIARCEKELAALKKPIDSEPLRQAVRQARKAGDLDVRLADARGKLVRAEQKAAVALAQLPGWDQPAESLRRLAAPLDATVDQFESRFQEIAQQRQALAEQLGKELDAIRECQAGLQALTLQQDVPTEESITAARTQRDQGWRLVKARWLEAASNDPKEAAFIAAAAPGASLAAAYEQTVEQADMLADRLRREADRVARSATLRAELEKHRAIRSELERELADLQDRTRIVESDWTALVAPLGITAQAKAAPELRAWLRRRDEVVQLLESVDEARQTILPLEQQMESHRRVLAQALDSSGTLHQSAGSDLAPFLDLAEALIKEQEDLARRSIQLESKRADTRTEQANMQLALQSAERELAVWHRDWSAKMSRIGLEGDAAPEQAEIILNEIAELLKVLDERRSLRLRISGIERDAQQFGRDVGAVAVRVAPDLIDRPPALVARELAARLRHAQADAKQSAVLTEQRQHEETNLRAAQTQLEEAQLSLEQLRRETNCNELSQLPEAELRSQKRTSLEAELAAVKEQLMAAAAGDDLDSFAGLVERADPGVLDTSIEELDTRIAALEDELRGADQRIGAARTALAQMYGSADAAETAEHIQTLLAGLQRDVARFATVRLASEVLKRGIEHYREKNQGAILSRAGDLFATLTAGSFMRLVVDDDDGNLVLKGVRADGRQVDVKGMSDGSHNQLYLALRLASLESWLESHEPIPFIVDDILLTFDDPRACAALRALAALSRTTQVLFFTHHRHLVDLALAHLPPEVVFLHELPAPGATPA